jgi:hypothetical protein
VKVVTVWTHELRGLEADRKRLDWIIARLQGEKWADSDFEDIRPRYDDPFNDPISKYIGERGEPPFRELIDAAMARELSAPPGRPTSSPPSESDEGREGFRIPPDAGEPPMHKLSKSYPAARQPAATVFAWNKKRSDSCDIEK